MIIKEENKLNKATNLISWISYSLEDLEKAKNKLDKNIELFKKNIDVVTKKASSFAEIDDDIYFEILEELYDDLRDYAQYVSSNINDTNAIKHSISELARYTDKYFYGESITKKNTKSIKEAMSTTKIKTYNTEFGPFVIETKEGKARRRNWSTGKVEWKQTISTNGYFKDYPSAVEFFLEKDGNDIYVSSSQGNYSNDWEEFVNAKNYGDAIDIVNDEVVKCFQDYYNNKSIY